MKIRNWRSIQPKVGHGDAIIYSIFRQRSDGESSTNEESQLIGIQNFTVHMIQSGKESDYHQHTTKEQLFYFTQGQGKMKLDDKLYEVKEGDAVHVPHPTKHQVINDSPDWLEHLIITTIIDPENL